MKGTYRIEEVAKILALHKATVKRFLREGKIKGVKLGTHRWRVTEDEVKRILGLQESQQKTGERA